MSEETSQPSTETASAEATTETQTAEAPAADQVSTDHGVDTGKTMSYANGKYDSVSALENGYAELQKSYSQKLGGFTGAPEAYELAEGIEVTPRIEALQDWAKENQMNNDAVNALIQMDQESTQAATEAYVASQKEALGKDADTRLTNLSEWARANVGEDNMDVFNGMITSARGVEMMEGLMKQMQGTAAAPAQAAPTVDADTIKQMRFAIDSNSGERRMSIDPAYRAKVEAMEAELYKR